MYCARLHQLVTLDMPTEFIFSFKFISECMRGYVTYPIKLD